jgi:hypothetical protein
MVFMSIKTRVSSCNWVSIFERYWCNAEAFAVKITRALVAAVAAWLAGLHDAMVPVTARLSVYGGGGGSSSSSSSSAATSQLHHCDQS